MKKLLGVCDPDFWSYRVAWLKDYRKMHHSSLKEAVAAWESLAGEDFFDGKMLHQEKNGNARTRKPVSAHPKLEEKKEGVVNEKNGNAGSCRE